MTDDLHDLNSRIKKSAEDFSLTPSPGVWKNVEREINRKKRKRRAFIWLWTGIAVLIGGGAWLMQSINGKEELVSDQQSETAETITSLQTGKADPLVYPEDSGVTVETDGAATDQEQAQMTAEQKLLRPVTEKRNDFIPDTLREEMDDQPSLVHEQHLEEKVEVVDVANEQLHPVDFSAEEPIPAREADSLQWVSGNDSLPEPVLPFVFADTLMTPGTDSDIVGPSRFSLGIGVAPALSFTHITEQGDHQGVSGYRNSTDKDLPALNVHLNVSYNLLSRLDMYSGISLTTYRGEMRSQQIVYQYDTGPVTGPVPPPVVVREENYLIDDAEYVTNSLTYIGMPLGIRYNVLPRNRFSIWLQSEVAYNRLVRFKGYVYDDNMGVYRSMTASDAEPWKFSCRFGIIVQRRLSNSLHLELSSAYRIFTGSVYQSSNLLSQKFAQAELQFALRYSFAK